MWGVYMAEVRWIKICTDMGRNKKIKRIRKLPDGDKIALIWVLLLLQAGESNEKGGLFLTETMPFTIEDLSIELDFEKDTMKFAIITLEKYGMIEVYDEVIYIKNWDEYQNINGLDKIREQTRQRVQRHRENQKLFTCNVTCNASVTQGNETELEKEKEKHIVHTNEFFESIWSIYPNKKGKAQVSNKSKKQLEILGFEIIKKCIERYKSNKEDWKEWQNGSTFFNSGYVDYLDENYQAKQETATSIYKDLSDYEP